MAEVKTLSRSEREAQIKDRAGWVITVIALLLAITTYMSSGFSSKILSNTIKANDTWNFYQAKSIKQSIAEGQLETTTDPKRKEQLQAKIDRYESDPEPLDPQHQAEVEDLCNTIVEQINNKHQMRNQFNQIINDNFDDI